MTKSIKKDIRRMTIDFPKELHRRYKLVAAGEAKTMRSIIMHALEEHLKKLEQENYQETPWK